MIGDITSTEIGPLQPNVKYYFKIHARNSKGYGPNSQVVSYRTRTAGAGGALTSAETVATGGGVAAGGNSGKNDSGIPAEVQYAIFAAGGVIVIVAVVFGLVMCRRGSRAAAAARDPSRAGGRGDKSYMKGESGAQREKLNPPPPDLWINHDQLELKSMDSNPDDRGGGGDHGAAGAVAVAGSSLARSTPVDLHGSTSTIDRSRFIAPYSGWNFVAKLFVDREKQIFAILKASFHFWYMIKYHMLRYHNLRF